MEKRGSIDAIREFDDQCLPSFFAAPTGYPISPLRFSFCTNRKNDVIDHLDFEQTCPLLDGDARTWLQHALELTAPDHKWTAVLAATVRSMLSGTDKTTNRV